MGDRLAFRLFAGLRRRAAVKSLFSGIVVPVNDLIGHQIIATGTFEATQFDGIGTLFEDEQFATSSRAGAFVDVGANIGLYTIAFAQRFRYCFAIEANPQTFKVLEANLVLRDIENVTAVCVGASDCPAETQIHVPVNGNLGWARIGTSYHESKAIAISVKPLDEILVDMDRLPIAMIKIDVEGHEPKVLEGARKTLTNDGPIVLFEILDAVESRRCHAILTDCGYRHFYVFRRTWPHGGNRLRNILRGLKTGLPASMQSVSMNDLRHAALICATKRPIRGAGTPGSTVDGHLDQVVNG
jgi:FkbM family methyltransferase